MHPDEASIPAPPLPATAPRTYYRWVVCGLLFLATTINYIDRQVIGVLKTTLCADLGWNEIDYADIVFAFQLAYALGYAVGGRIMDLIGVRIGYGVAVLLWSVAAMAHAGMRTVFGFQMVRLALGLTEGGNFPAAIKTVTEWFPSRERALATGIFNAGSNVGALVTPIAVPWLTTHYGWPAAFLVTGSLGFFWLIGWWALYRSPEVHPRVSAAELAHIRSDPPDPPAKIPWLNLLKHRQTWAFVVGTAMTSPIWWFYLFWIPGFLQQKYGLNLLQVGPPLVVIYLMTDVGSVGGGWLSSTLMKRGWTTNRARKTAFLVCALCVVPVAGTAFTANLWLAVFLVGLAASAHQGFSANLYTLVSDTVPRKAVSSVVGIGGMAGAIGGMFNAKLAGFLLQHFGNTGYVILFMIASTAYLIALAAIHALLPRMEPMKLESSQ